MSHLQSPDMVAFTIGTVALSLMQDHGTVSGDSIETTLRRIASGCVPGRVSREMALGALLVITTKSYAAG